MWGCLPRRAARGGPTHAEQFQLRISGSRFPRKGDPSRRRVRRAALRRFLHHLVGPTRQEALEQETVELEAVEQEAQTPVRRGARVR